MSKRLIIGLTTGAILGVFCIIGAQVRFGATLSAAYLFSFWYNRVIMGLVIGLFASNYKLRVLLLRGAIVGALVSLAFYSATEFNDLVGFLAGIAYGVIIEFVLYKVVK
ncbi:MAG: hypothetical protein KKH92_10405 [Firmicutes bacterium]|nr:hypothetical protein [Bacillota bacterium]